MRELRFWNIDVARIWSLKTDDLDVTREFFECLLDRLIEVSMGLRGIIHRRYLLGSVEARNGQSTVMSLVRQLVPRQRWPLRITFRKVIRIDFMAVLLLVTALLPLIGSGPEFQWEAVSGEWKIVGREGSGKGTDSRWALMLSTDWFADFEFSGELSLPNSLGKEQLAAIIVDYAAESEFYAIIIDPQRSRVYVQENHFGQSEEIGGSSSINGLGKGLSIRFRVTAKGGKLLATLWPNGENESKGISLSVPALQIPDGRLGVGVLSGELTYSGFSLHSTSTSFSAYVSNDNTTSVAYAFHCHFRLPDKESNEPLWQYLDAVASSSSPHYPKSFSSLTDFQQYKKDALIRLRDSLGLNPWPDRTPLNARTVGVLDREDYKIEKVIFESQPGFLVDALLYLPQKVTFPVPGILSTIGHYGDDDFFIWSEQARCIGLAKKGYVVLTYDPISQGERKWLGDGDHDTLRRKIILSGMEASGLMFWDSIRAIDYLSSRPEVDPQRIGVTGVSGGGFNALYTAVLDERVKAVAPDGFATTLEALIKRASAGCCVYLPNLNQYADMENIYSFIAPRNLLILGGYLDHLSDRILPIYGTARKVYGLYGAEGNVKYFLDENSGHTYSKPMRLEMYRWFNYWLKGIEDPDAAREPIDPEKFLISKDSGLLRVFRPGERGKDVVDLEREYLARNKTRLALPSNRKEVKTFQTSMKQQLVELMGDMAPATPPLVSIDDKKIEPGSVRNIVLHTERDLPVALEVHHPALKQDQRTLVIFFAMEDRNAWTVLSASEMVQKLVATGFTVAVPQVRGTGTTVVQDMASVELFAMALGKHLFSTRIYDLERVIDYLLAQPEYKSLRVALWGEGTREGLMALYLAATDSRVHVAISSHGLVSYQDIVDKDGLPDFDYYVPGILKYTDVPQIISTISPRRVLLSAAVGIDGRVLGSEEMQRAYVWASDVYRISGHHDELSIIPEGGLVEALRRRLHTEAK
jgi:dienelactone hydrolase